MSAPPNGPARLSGHGLAVQLPNRWEGRIYRRVEPRAAAASSHVRQADQVGWPGEHTHPVMHLANFALPASRGDFGTGAVETMGPRHAFVVLLEYGADCLGSVLYAGRGLPTLAAGLFDSNGLQRQVAGQVGFQHFFTSAARPFCLYVVLGSRRKTGVLCAEVNAVLGRIEMIRP